MPATSMVFFIHYMRHEPLNGFLFVELQEDMPDGEFKVTAVGKDSMREAKIISPGDTSFAPGTIVLLRPGSWEALQSGDWKGHIIHKDAVLACVKPE